MAKDFEDVDSIEMIEELHERLDVLITLLEEKKLLKEGEFERKYDEYQEKKED